MKNILIIPAKGNSKGIKKKNLKCIRFLVKNSHNYLEFKIENFGSKIIHV